MQSTCQGSKTASTNEQYFRFWSKLSEQTSKPAKQNFLAPLLPTVKNDLSEGQSNTHTPHTHKQTQRQRERETDRQDRDRDREDGLSVYWFSPQGVSLKAWARAGQSQEPEPRLGPGLSLPSMGTSTGRWAGNGAARTHTDTLTWDACVKQTAILAPILEFKEGIC